MMINVHNINLFTQGYIKSLEKNQVRQAGRYLLLTIHEFRRQYHMAAAQKIWEHSMTPIMFKIEIDAEFETTKITN